MTHINNGKEVFQIEIQGLTEVQNRLNSNFDKAIDAILNTTGRVVVTGMGKSGLIGRKIAATMASTGTPTFFMHPAEAYHGDLGMIASNDVILAISNSGETEELIRLMSFFKDNKNTVIAMAGKSGSTLARYADIFLDIGISKEACPLELAPTTSTTVTLAMGDAIAISLMKARNFKEENFARFHPGGSLGRKLLVKVRDVMKTQKLPILNADMEFSEAISVISGGLLGIGVLVQDQKAIGVITDGDIRRLLLKEKEKALSFKVKDFYTKNPKVINADEKIVVAETLMNERKITTLIVEEDGHFVGILHRYDF
jgi:arabinose-5-phosphate isomerase